MERIIDNKQNQIAAYGAEDLCDLVLPQEQAEILKQESANYPRVTLTQRQICDLELLMNGAYSPLTGFMCEDDYNAVVDNMRLANGLLWPMPITFDVTKAFIEQHKINTSSKIALQDGEGFMLAVLSVSSIWTPDKEQEAEKIYGTGSLDHPGVHYLKEKTHSVYIGGSIEGVQLPEYYVFGTYRRTPLQQRAILANKGWKKVIGYQTSKIIHRLHREFLLDIAKEYQAQLLIHPTIGSTKPGDTHYYTRVHCYEAVLKYFPKQLTMLSIMPLSMRMAGARESLWYGILHQNYGCTHFVVGPNHASPPQNTNNNDCYAAQKLVKQYENELAIKMIPVEEYQYVVDCDCFLPLSKINKRKKKGLRFSEQKIREALHLNKLIPKWCSYPEVIQEMKAAYPPRSKQGFTLFFTGLSGSGKSTIAKIVNAQLIEHGARPVTLLDGDVVRLNLSSELGFSKQHRDLNIRRIGFVANEITKNGGVAICAPIAPYAKTRRSVRELVEQYGSFIEIHVSTPLEICEGRDRKGLYAKARKGIIPEFTGISDPYEIPEKPELDIDTSAISPLEASQMVILYLFQKGYVD
jgi:sulfate adenylyltransferase